MNINDIVNKLNATITEDSNCTEKAELIVAIALTLHLPVPGENNGADGAAYFTTNYSEKVKQIVNAVNEKFLLDTTKVLRFVKQLYIFRFNVVHCASKCIDQIVQMGGVLTEMENPTNFPSIEPNDIRSVLIVMNDTVGAD